MYKIEATQSMYTQPFLTQKHTHIPVYVPQYDCNDPNVYVCMTQDQVQQQQYQLYPQPVTQYTHFFNDDPSICRRRMIKLAIMFSVIIIVVFIDLYVTGKL